MPRLKSIVLAAFLMVALGQAAAVAAKADPGEPEARAAFLQGDYADALKRYTSLEISTHKAIYYRSIARCHEEMGKFHEAIENFEKYLANDSTLTDADKEKTRQSIADLKEKEAKVATPPAAVDAPPTPPPVPAQPLVQPTPTPPPGPPSYPPPSPPTPAPVEPAPAPSPPPPDAPSPWTSMRISGLVIGGVGVAAVVVGAVFGAQAKDSADQLNAKAALPGATYDATLKSLDDKGRSDQTKEWIFVGAGAAAVAAGVVLAIVGGPSPEGRPAGASAMTLLPLVSARDVGASFEVTF